jgi:hypothetical protein
MCNNKLSPLEMSRNRKRIEDGDGRMGGDVGRKRGK